jgi:hypothetical protein
MNYPVNGALVGDMTRQIRAAMMTSTDVYFSKSFTMSVMISGVKIDIIAKKHWRSSYHCGGEKTTMDFKAKSNVDGYRTDVLLEVHGHLPSPMRAMSMLCGFLNSLGFHSPTPTGLNITGIKTTLLAVFKVKLYIPIFRIQIFGPWE